LFGKLPTKKKKKGQFAIFLGWRGRLGVATKE